MAEHTFFIAEAGVNHNGSLDMALRLVDVAASAGADAVKFQTFKADQLATAKAAKAEYQVANTQEAGFDWKRLKIARSPYGRPYCFPETQRAHTKGHAPQTLALYN